MRAVLRIIIALGLPLWIYSCAQQVSPTGGQKDNHPPQLLKSEPLNFSTNFSGTDLKIRFDEFIQLKNINQQLIISPEIEGREMPKVKGKSLTIFFGDSLLANTTYQINFGDGVVDYNESNPLDSNLFIFSTGEFIDSLTLSGQVIDAFTHQAIEGAVVMLYQDHYDSIPYKELPVYRKKTDGSGKFYLNYLKAGTYKVIVLKEVNNNYLFDNPDEQIGFCDNIILPKDSGNLTLQLFTEEQPRNQYIVSSSYVSPGLLRFVFNEPVLDFKIDLLGVKWKKPWSIIDINSLRDTVDCWLTGLSGFDKLSALVYDSLLIDTVQFVINPDTIVNELRIKHASKIRPFDSLKLVFSEPLLDPVIDNLRLISAEDSSEMSVQIHKISKGQRKLWLGFDYKDGKDYILSIFPGCFTSIYKSTNTDTLITKISVKPLNKLADINLELNLDSLKVIANKYVLQLINSKQEVTEQQFIDGSGTYHFTYLNAGNYSLALIFDSNENNKWDTGSYLKNIQPERVIIYDGKIEMEAGWDVELKWNLKD